MSRRNHKAGAAGGRIRLLLADDHAIVRKGIKCCLESESQFEFVGEAGTGRQAISRARSLRPDVILMDVNMPELDGLQATAHLRRAHPAIKILILTVYDSREFILRAVQSGASGYLLKNCPPRELVQAIKIIHAGGEFFAPNVTQLLAHEFVHQAQQPHAHGAHPLSNREREVLGYVARGSFNKEIAEALHVGVRSVETYRKRLMKKLGIRTVAGLTRYAVANGLADS
jgi:DNA-binding NarL/FixJ family response regulator